MDSRHRREPLRRVAAVLGAISICTGAVLGLTATGAGAAPPPSGYELDYSPVGNEENTYSDIEELTAKCPEGIVGTPGSDPATKKIDFGDSTDSQIHYYFDDNPDRTDEDFQVQDCVVGYPSDFFTETDFNEFGQLESDYSKHDLTKGGEVLDQATLFGSADSTQEIHFYWNVSGVSAGDWVCNYARDVNNQHQGGGNRKVLPACYQVEEAPPGDELTPAVEIDRGDCRAPDVVTIEPKLHVLYYVDGSQDPVPADDLPLDIELDEDDEVAITAEAEEGFDLESPPEEMGESWHWEFTGSAQGSCGSSNNNDPDPDPTDLCANIDGVQTQIPTDLYFGPGGECLRAEVLALTEEPAPVITPEVLPEVLTTQPPQLPFTGNDDSMRLAAVAASLMAIGSVLVLASRRRATID